MNASDTPPPEPKFDESALRSKLLTVPSIIVENVNGGREVQRV